MTADKQAKDHIADAIRELAKTMWRPDDNEYQKNCVSDAKVELDNALTKLREDDDE